MNFNALKIETWLQQMIVIVHPFFRLTRANKPRIKFLGKVPSLLIYLFRDNLIKLC